MDRDEAAAGAEGGGGAAAVDMSAQVGRQGERYDAQLRASYRGDVVRGRLPEAEQRPATPGSVFPSDTISGELFSSLDVWCAPPPGTSFKLTRLVPPSSGVDPPSRVHLW